MWKVACCLLAGCFSPKPSPGAPCDDTEPTCPSGLVCTGGTCEVPGGALRDGAPGDLAPDDDTDGDGIANASDNCPAVANATQYDEDGDAHGDACDKCPPYADPEQDDADGDGVSGDCDPTPETPSESWVTFEGFHEPAPAGWSIPSDWTIEDGVLKSPTDPTISADAVFDTVVTNALVLTRTQLVAVDPAPGSFFRSVGPLTAVSPGAQYRCLIRDTPTLAATAGVSRDATPLSNLAIGGAVADARIDMRFVDDDDRLRCVGETADGRSWSSLVTDGMHGAGAAGVRVQRVSATFAFVGIIAIE